LQKQEVKGKKKKEGREDKETWLDVKYGTRDIAKERSRASKSEKPAVETGGDF
jgi:hypothetical protein